MDITGMGTTLMDYVKSALPECVNLEHKSTSGNGDYTQFHMEFDIESSVVITQEEEIRELCKCDKVFIDWDGHENGFAHYKVTIHYDNDTLIKYLDER